MLNFFNERRRKGQSTLEYAVLIIIVIGALLSIQIYIKRGVQGRLKSATDDIGDQYSPGNTNVFMKTIHKSKKQEVYTAGLSTTTDIDNEENRTDGFKKIINVEQEFWHN